MEREIRKLWKAWPSVLFPKPTRYCDLLLISSMTNNCHLSRHSIQPEASQLFGLASILHHNPPLAHQRAWTSPGTYSAGWSWGSARPRCRRSRGCGCRHCQNIHFLLEHTGKRPVRFMTPPSWGLSIQVCRAGRAESRNERHWTGQVNPQQGQRS